MSATTTSGASSRTSGSVSRGGVDDGFVEVERLGALREDLVLGGGREADALGLDVLLPALPGLQRDVVPARDERAPERDHREGVAGVAEGAEQHAQSRGRGVAGACGRARACGVAQAARLRRRARQAGAAARRRSAAVKAVGVTPSVPTPASR